MDERELLNEPTREFVEGVVVIERELLLVPRPTVVRPRVARLLLLPSKRVVERPLEPKPAERPVMPGRRAVWEPAYQSEVCL